MGSVPRDADLNDSEVPDARCLPVAAPPLIARAPLTNWVVAAVIESSGELLVANHASYLWADVDSVRFEIPSPRRGRTRVLRYQVRGRGTGETWTLQYREVNRRNRTASYLEHSAERPDLHAATERLLLQGLPERTEVPEQVRQADIDPAAAGRLISLAVTVLIICGAVAAGFAYAALNSPVALALCIALGICAIVRAGAFLVRRHFYGY